MIVVVSIDPATASGWAVHVDGKLHAYGKIHPTTALEAYRILRHYKAQFPDADLHIVVEGQYLFTPKIRPDTDAEEAVKATGNRFRSIAKVIKIAGGWCWFGELLGYTLMEDVVSQSWQGPLGVATLAKTMFSGKSSARKRAAVYLVGQWYGYQVTFDEADAILLGRWRSVDLRAATQLSLLPGSDAPRRRTKSQSRKRGKPRRRK